MEGREADIYGAETPHLGQESPQSMLQFIPIRLGSGLHSDSPVPLAPSPPKDKSPNFLVTFLVVTGECEMHTTSSLWTLSSFSMSHFLYTYISHPSQYQMESVCAVMVPYHRDHPSGVICAGSD